MDEDKLCMVNEINESLKAYFYHHHLFDNKDRDERIEENSSLNMIIDKTMYPNTASTTPHIKNSIDHKRINERKLLLSSSQSNSKSSSLLDEETSSSSSSSSSCLPNDDSRDPLMLNSLPRSSHPNLTSKLNTKRLVSKKNLNMSNHPRRPPPRYDADNRNYLTCKSSSNMMTNDLTVMTMATNTLPRKPRSIRSIKKMNMSSNANRSGTISTTEATNTTSVTNTADQYCFINTSYAATSSPNPSSTLHILRNQHFNHESSNQTTLKSRDYCNNSLRTIERLKRPSAPPPPPPPPPPPQPQPQQSSVAVPNIGSPQLTSTPNRRVPLGFESALPGPFYNHSTGSTSENRHYHHMLRLKPVKNPARFDLIVLIAALALFTLCILAVSLFQTKANQFYMRFMNISRAGNNETTNNSRLNEIEQIEAAAGSQLVKQTILVCNGPWFSYQMNNLLVLPFSLTLLVIFSFVKKKQPHPNFSRKTRLSKSSKCSRPHLPSGLNPFQRRNRFLVAALFCILANEIFKMIESSMFVTPTTAFNSTSELFNSVFSNSNSINTSSTIQQSSNDSNARDLLRIGLGIEPEQFAQQKSRLFGSKLTSKQPPTTRTMLPTYVKPKLRPRLNQEDFESTSTSNMVINFRLDVGEQIDRLKQAQNKSLLIISSFNSTVQNSSSQTLFEFSMSLYRNEYVQSALHKLVESCSASQLKWSIIWSRLEKVGVILIEVLVIGLRYYPLMGVLDTDNRLVCVALAAVYMWLDIAYNIAITGLCEGLRLNVSFELLKNVRAFFGVGSVLDHKALKNSNQLDARFLFSKNRIIYTLVKSLPHFFCLAYVTMRLTCVCSFRLFKLVYAKVQKRRDRNTRMIEDEKCVLNGFIVETSRNYDLVYTKVKPNDITSKRRRDEEFESNKQLKELSFEDRYIGNLLKTTTESLNSKWLNKIIDSNFRYSIRTVCTYTVCFTVLYYFTCFFCFYSSIFIDLIYFPQVYKEFLSGSALLTSFVCFVQLTLSLRQFKHHLKSLYQGRLSSSVSEALFSSPRSNRAIATASFNYAGYAVTYTCWGYIILFALMSFIAFQAATLVVFGGGLIGLTLFLLVLLLPFVVSVVLMKLLNRFMGSLAARFCFLQRRSRVLALKNARLYSLFLYFKFFYDCFAGLALCLVRILKALLLAVLFMTRLDCALMGNRRLDAGYMAYVGYVYWEAAHTNPIVIGFCEMVARESRVREIKRREERRCGTLTMKWAAAGHMIHSQDGYSGVRARSRWFLAYTLISNSSLVALRKRKRN